MIEPGSGAPTVTPWIVSFLLTVNPPPVARVRSQRAAHDSSPGPTELPIAGRLFNVFVVTAPNTVPGAAPSWPWNGLITVSSVTVVAPLVWVICVPLGKLTVSFAALPLRSKLANSKRFTFACAPVSFVTPACSERSAPPLPHHCPPTLTDQLHSPNQRS